MPVNYIETYRISGEPVLIPIADPPVLIVGHVGKGESKREVVSVILRNNISIQVTDKLEHLLKKIEAASGQAVHVMDAKAAGIIP